MRALARLGIDLKEGRVRDEIEAYTTGLQGELQYNAQSMQQGEGTGLEAYPRGGSPI